METDITVATQSASLAVEVPTDLVHLSLDEQVLIKCKGGRELRGKLHAYDEHLNMVLGDVEEKITRIEVNPDTLEETTNVQFRTFELLFIRGDSVIMFSNLFRST